MKSPEEILSYELDAIMLELEEKYIESGMKASGQWAESLENRTEMKGDVLEGVIMGEPYTDQLVNGRRPGKFPPIAAIQKWIYDKGITAGDDITYKQLAFLIARKIARSGTKYYQQGGTDLIESVVTPERIGQIIDKMRDSFITSTREILKRELAV